MSKHILGLDLGTNSIGWALLEEDKGQPTKIIDLGSRIFIRAVEEKTPTPKNVKRREARLTRRVIQRRARRKKRMLHYLVKLGLLPSELVGHSQPEIILNTLGDPYQLRKKASDHRLDNHELGRVLLHLVQRRGFLSNRKTLLSDMLDDPDVQAVFAEHDDEDEDNASKRMKEEKQFNGEIKKLRETIKQTDCRTLGEYLASLEKHECKRNRGHDEAYLRTDRQMYRDELDLIWREQTKHHAQLQGNVKEQIQEIIFYQRPLKLRPDRIGKCSLEPTRKRANMARLEAQQFRFLQDINSMYYSDPDHGQKQPFTPDQRKELIDLFEHDPAPSFAKIKKKLNLHRKTEFNLANDTKKLKGNTTACKIRKVLDDWDAFDANKQMALVEDLLTIKKKPDLKNRLMLHWSFDGKTAVRLCELEFEGGYSRHSVKVINRLLPFLEHGQIYSEARQNAGYGYENKKIKPVDRLGPSPDLPNPIVKKALAELRRLINALIAEYGKPDAIRIEMARDLKMSKKALDIYEKQQIANKKTNDAAIELYQQVREKNPHLNLPEAPSLTDKIKFRLWKEQKQCCAYSGKIISCSTLFSEQLEIDHILPQSQSLDNAYMNKVICYAEENRHKGQRTPIDAFGGNTQKWEQITQAINNWDSKLMSKKNRFFTTAEELQGHDFINSQLNDTRYICTEAKDYVLQLGVDVNVSKGGITAIVRRLWGIKKDRSDHRHHAIDAVVTAYLDRRFYRELVRYAKAYEQSHSEFNITQSPDKEPWPNFRNELQNKLDEMIVAHTPQRKLYDELHEKTGYGFIEGQGTVYRKRLREYFNKCTTEKDADKKLKGIYEKPVRNAVKVHLAKHGFNAKTAFAEGVTVFHENGKTPIKRVRILKSKTANTKKELENSKFGIKDKQGEVFKWMQYGNLHHVEICRHKETGEYTGFFVTMMEASHRVRGINRKKQSIIKTDHGENHEFIMALHINDLVTVKKNHICDFYRVQKLESGGNRIILRLHTAAKIDNKDEEIFFSINKTSFKKWQLSKVRVNAIGKQVE